MRLRVGQTLTSAVDGTSVIVVRCSEADVRLTCGGVEMSGRPTAASTAEPSGAPDDGLLLGKRYSADEVGLELLCVRAGTRPVEVDGEPLAQKTAKPLPASD
jgi:hypothetical protein